MTQGEARAVRFPWQAREYVRTCEECGYCWRVPRSAARRRMTSINMFTVTTGTRVDRAELAREVTSISAANQQANAFRHCPQCGADHFTQRPGKPLAGSAPPGSAGGR
jgi:hypothetical protein